MIDAHRERGRILRQFEWSETPPSVAISKTIADFEQTDPMRTIGTADSPLYEYIDTDALDVLIASDTPLEITFPVSQYHVHVSGNTVCISAPERTPSATQ